MSLSSGPHPLAGQVRAAPYLPLVARPSSVPPPWAAHWPQTAQPLGTSGTEQPVAGAGPLFCLSGGERGAEGLFAFSEARGGFVSEVLGMVGLSSRFRLPLPCPG